MNQVIRNLTIQNFESFRNSFNETKNIFWDEKTGKLKHSGEFGSYREELVKKWLRIVVPEKFGISSVFLINDQGSISTQCDIIIYDKTTTPKIENIDNQRFFPVETVSCIGEIKSDVNSLSDLNKYLIKLAEIKKLREGVSDPSPYYRKESFSTKTNSFDNIYSFLICNKLKFELDISKINYNEVEQRFKHNVVLSLQDGIINYISTNGSANLNIPFNGDKIHSNYFLKNDNKELPCHILSFLTSLHIALSLTNLLRIDITHYLTDDILNKIE